MYQNFIILYLYKAEHVSDDTPPMSGTYCTWQRPPTTRPTTFHVWKTRGCQCSFGLLMMGGVSPETCWASYRYGIIKFWYIVASCWIFLYEFYYDARIHEHPDYMYSCLSWSFLLFRIFSLCINMTVYVAIDNWVAIRTILQSELLIASLLAVAILVEYGVVWDNESKSIWYVNV
jgi:hypothetical protein